jgi:hypothetical protein
MKVAFSDKLRALLSDPEAARQFQEWTITGKPDLITFHKDGDEITVRPQYVLRLLDSLAPAASR